MSEYFNKPLIVTEEIFYWIGVTIDVLFVIYFSLLFILEGSFMGSKSLYLGIGLISHYLLKLIIFGALLYPWGIRVNIPGCNRNTGDKICEVRDKRCIPGTCGEYEEVERYFNIDSYKKYLTIKNTSIDIFLNGSSRKYDLTRLITSEIISFMTCIVYLLFLYFSYNNSYLKTIINRIVGLILIIITILMIIFNDSDKDTNYIDSIQLTSISIALALMILFSLFNKISALYKISLLMIIIFVVIPRIMMYLQKECIYKTQSACLKSEGNDYNSNCKWHKTRRKCINLESGNDSIFGGDSSDSGGGGGGGGGGSGGGGSGGGLPTCRSYNTEETCLDNDCHFVKLNVGRNKLNEEGKSKVDSKTGCISNNDICSEYSCTGDFYPLNIFDECCNNELYENGCTDDEIQSHLDGEKDILDETKQEGSDIKTLYGEEAWSKKVDFDESYRYCESKNRRAEIDADIYA